MTAMGQILFESKSESHALRVPDFGAATTRDLDLVSRAQQVADVATASADRVDRDAVFPHEAIEAARRHRLFSLLIPRDLGGDGASIAEVADVCYTLGQSCASTAMIVAMHQAALACIVRHHRPGSWHEALLRRIAQENLLLASSTTEGSAGGNVRSSDAALVRDGTALQFSRAATVMSYGAQADGIVSTARRDPDAPASDQVLIVLTRPDYALTGKGGWDTLGMRGTCSSGFGLEARAAAAQVLPLGYDKIHPLTMVPISHLTWAAVWTGIAAAAVAKAQMFVRTAARKSGGQMPPGAIHATRANATLRSLRGMLRTAIVDFEGIADDEPTLSSMETQTALNLFKVEASEHAVAAVQSAMRACGLAGYRNDGEFGIGRHLRDVLSAPIMIHNERIVSNIASAALMSGIPSSLQS